MKITLIALTIIIISWITTGATLTIYDNNQRQNIYETAHRELSPGDSDDKMSAFMSKYTEKYQKDNKYQFRYSGIAKQSRIDKIIFNRKVKISLDFDPITGHYKDCSVSVVYTFL